MSESFVITNAGLLASDIALIDAGGADITPYAPSHTLSVSLDQGISLTSSGQFLSPFTITDTGAVENASGAGVYSVLTGVYLANAGQVTGSTYGALIHASGTIINQGSISGLGDRGVFLFNGGAVQNAGVNSVIYGGQVGVADQSNNLYVSNQGSIIGGSFDGVILGEGGLVNNAGTFALITGLVYGVEVFPDARYAGTVNNHGTIYGAQGAGVYFLTGAAGSGNAVTNNGTIMAGAMGREGVGAVNLAITVVNQGLISGPDGIDLKSGGTVTNGGTIAGARYAVYFGGNTNQLVVDPGAVFIGNVAAAANASNLLELGVGAGSLGGFGSAVTGFPRLAFDVGAAWTLAGDGAGFNGDTIAGFSASDTIWINDLMGVSGASYLTAGSGGVLMIPDGDNPDLQLTFSGDDGAVFALSADHAGGTILTQAICYLRGTRILTPTGEMRVQELAIGDVVVTRFSGLQKIKWIGRQSFEPHFRRNNPAKIPVCIHAGALGEGLPARDLFVSPGHSMLLGGVLVLASTLVNGVTVTQKLDGNGAAPIDYFQIELAAHDCVIAEGTWAESYADAPGMRDQFHNAAEYYALYPETAPAQELQLCAPRPERGMRLEAALRPVAAIAAAAVAPGRLHGFVESVSAWRIEGWAMDSDHPELPVLLEIVLDDAVIGTILACDARDDLREAGKGTGRCAFVYTAARPLPPEAWPRVGLRRAGGGAKAARLRSAA